MVSLHHDISQPPSEASQLDVNLEELRFLLTLWETQSLTAAAAKHRLSMGSASRRLSHLRDVFGDELFVRSGLLMLPTGRMRELCGRLKSVLSSAADLFANEAFDLQRTKRVVTILSVDNGVITLLNDAIGRFFQSAPNASLSIQPIDEQLFERLRNGSADMALFPIKDVPKDFHVLELYRTRRGVLVREGHPLIERFNKKGAITLEDMSAYKRVNITFSGAPDWNRNAAAAIESAQQAAVSMPYFLAVPTVLAQTDFTYVAPVVTLMHFVRLSSYMLRMLPAPIELAPFTPCLIWHHATHADPFLQWVRAVITDGCRNQARALGAMADVPAA